MTDKPIPGKPAPYLPTLGQKNLTPDQINAAQIKSQNTVPTQGAATVNDVRQMAGANDGKQYTGAVMPISDAVAQKLQEYTDTATIARGPKGEKGDPGDTGPRGLAGPRGLDGAAGKDGVVDYDLVRSIIQELLDQMLNFKVLQYVKPTPTMVFGGKFIDLPVEFADTMANTSAVVQANYTLAIPGAGTINGAGHLIASAVTVDTLTAVVANYVDSKGKNYTASTNVTIKVLKPSSLSVSGPSSINSAGTGTYAATVTYTDGATKVVTLDPGTTWTIQSGTIGTLNNNVLSAPVVGANSSGVVKATYVEGAFTVSGTANVTITAPANKAFYGAAAIPIGTGTYGTINWSDFIQTLTPGATARATTFAANLGPNQYGWYAAPVSFGITADTQFLDTDSGEAPGGWGGATTPITGAATGSPPRVVGVSINGSTVQYNLWRTDYPNLGSTHWKIN